MYKRQLKNPQNTAVRKEFKDLQKLVNATRRKLKTDQMEHIMKKAGTDGKKMWSVINRELKRDSTKEKIIEKLEVDGTVTDEKTDIAWFLNDFFVHTGSRVAGNSADGSATNVLPEVKCRDSIGLEDVTTEEVIKSVLELKGDSAPGHDGITSNDVKILIDIIADVLKNLIQKCLMTGNFPDELKITKIIPIYKSGSKRQMNNYRPIALISTFSKIIEKVIKTRLLTFIEQHVGFDSYQYGFVCNSNAQSAVTDLLDCICNSLDKKKYAVAVFIDLSKAFDVVNHKLLLKKLYSLGIRGELFNLIKSYLTDRKQYVYVNDVCSKNATTISGVPQGSILGPLLYILYVLSLRAAGLKARYFTFADDTALVYTGEDLNIMQKEINDDLERYDNWLTQNHLKINKDKTVFMMFKQKNKFYDSDAFTLKIKSSVIKEVSFFKYMGIQIDNRLLWDKHYELLCSRTIKMIGALYRTENVFGHKIRKIVYHAYYENVFRYLITVWGTCSDTLFNKFVILQKKIIKCLFGLDRLTPTNSLFDQTKFYELPKLLKIEQYKYAFKITNNAQKTNVKNIKLNCDLHEYATRAKNNVHLASVTTNVGLNNPFTRALQSFNQLPNVVKTDTNYKNYKRNIYLLLSNTSST